MKRSFMLLSLLLSVSTFGTVARGEETITYLTAGGVYLENIKKAFLEPIGKQLGIQWNIETGDEDTSIRIQAQTGAITTDVVEFGAAMCAQGAKEGLYEELDFSIIDTSKLAPGSFTDHYVGSTIFSIVLAWNPKTVPNPPKTWAEFWDVEKFPGNRALRRDPRSMLELALMADGVEPDKLYPLDLDRAIASLRKIKPHIKAWWMSGAESQQLLRDGGIDMLAMYNARVESVKSDGGDAAYDFNQGLIDYGCWAIVKGSPKVDLSMKVLAEFVKADYQAEMTLLSNYGASNTEIDKTGKIPAELLPKLPTSPENLPRQVFLDAAWWAENGTVARERFDQFLTE